jgi:DNA-binding response OmpR family regulator
LIYTPFLGATNYLVLILKIAYTLLMKKILVVDDDANFLSSLTAKLALGKYEVDAVQTGKEALKHIHEHNPDIVVLDLNLPDIHGHKVLQESKDEYKEKMKFIVCTNYDTKGQKDERKELGATDYLVKAEYTLDELVDKISVLAD